MRLVLLFYEKTQHFKKNAFSNNFEAIVYYSYNSP